MNRLRWQEPNLARTPFVNERPVRRLAVTLWVLFAIVAGIATWLSVSLRQETGTRIAELTRLNTDAVAARERATTLERELRAANLPAQNERTNFLNRRLAERSFSWGRLLETLAQTMPRGVRLMRLAPEGFARERGRGAAGARTAATTRVALRITGEAEETEPMLEFVDRLFEHPAFDRPNLSRESERKDTRIQFELTVSYLPEVAHGLAETAAGATRIGQAAGAPGIASAAAGRPATAAVSGSAGAGLAGRPTAGETAAAGVPAVAGRPAQSLKATSSAAAGATRTLPGGSAWDGGETAGPGEVGEAGASGKGRAGAAGTRAPGLPDVGGVPSAPSTSGFDGPGASPGAPSAAPRPGTPAPFPANVMPTPLRPYASSTGGGQ